MRIDDLIIRNISNFETPFQIVGHCEMATMDLTNEELVELIAEWFWFILDDTVEVKRSCVGYKFHLQKA